MEQTTNPNPRYRGLRPYRVGDGRIERYKARMAEEVARLTDQFRRVHNREPEYYEVELMTDAAEIALRLRSRTATDKERRERGRKLRQLGFVTPRRGPPSASSSAAKSGRQFLDEAKS
jgi:hypothetical protein